MGKDVNLGDFDARTPMHVVGVSGNKQMFELLMAKKPDLTI